MTLRAGALVIYMSAAAKGILRNYQCVVSGWFVGEATTAAGRLPGECCGAAADGCCRRLLRCVAFDGSSERCFQAS